LDDPLWYHLPVDFAGIDWSWIGVNVAVLLFSLSVHESAHAWSADRLGDPTARMQGRVTLNPIVHLDWFGSLLFPFIGFLVGGIIFGWAKPVPVNTANLSRPKMDHVWIAAAGPASNIAAAIFFFLILKLFLPAGSGGEGALSILWLVCAVGVFLNVVLAVFNLLPIPPLDGGWILEGLLPDSFSSWFDAIRPYGFIILVGLLYMGFIGAVLQPVLHFVRSMIL
jgi:Zn-dependent protease